MKKIIVVLLGVIFTLVTGSIHYISADDSTDNQRPEIVVVTKDSKFQLHIQVIFRNAQDQLIGATEGTYSAYIPHKLTDVAFDTMFGEKEIVTVDGIKYEKIQFTQRFQSTVPPNHGPGTAGLWLIEACGKIVNEHLGIECANIFEMRTNQMVLEDDDVIETQWTILRTMN